METNQLTLNQQQFDKYDKTDSIHFAKLNKFYGLDTLQLPNEFEQLTNSLISQIKKLTTHINSFDEETKLIEKTKKYKEKKNKKSEIEIELEIELETPEQKLQKY